MLKHREIYIFNFKSFEGMLKIGPLKSHSISAIIGPNGTGKSNIIDAIAFCMGEKSINLRVTKIQDLVHKSRCSDSRNAFVACKFQLKNGNEIIFKRSIARNLSEYQINNQVIAKQKYHEELDNLNINITAKNFIIYQDDISSILMDSPKDRTILFERMSHSIDFKEKYDYLKNKVDEFYSKTKNYRDEKRILVADHKKLLCAQFEKKKLLGMQEDYDKTLIQLALFDLYINELQRNENNRHLDEMKTKIVKLIEEKQEFQANLDGKKIELSGLIATATTIESKINDIQKQYDDTLPDYMNNKEKIIKCNEQLNKIRKALEIAAKTDESRDRQIAELEEELKEIIEAKDRYVQNLSQQFETSLETMAQWDRKYDELKGTISKHAAKYYLKLNTLERKIQPLMDKMENEKRKCDEIKSNIDRKTNFKNNIEKRMDKMQDYIQETVEKLDIQRAVYTELNENINTLDENRETLENELKIINEKLNDCEITEKQWNKIKDENYIVETLRHSFSKVHDRIYNLLKPINNRYKIAFTKVFAPYFSNIVVDNTEIALKCIKYSKMNALERSTFLPLDENLRVEKLKEKLRSFEQEEGIKYVKLLYDVIAFSPEMERIVLHIARNTLVCETDKMARHVAYYLPSGVKYDCVSLDGTYYRKNGLFSGGTVTLMEKSKILNAKLREEIQIKKDEICRALKKIHNNIDRADLQILNVEIEMLKRKLNYYNNHMMKMTNEFEMIVDELKKLNDNYQLIEETILKIEVEMDESNKIIDAIQIKINKIEDRIFADFCIEVNVPNIRKYEKPLKLFREMKLKELEYDEQCERIKSLLSYEKERNTKHDVKKWTKNLNNTLRQIEEQRVIEKDIEKKYNKQKNLLNDYQETLAVTTCEIEKLKIEIAEDERSLKKILNYQATLDEKSFASKIMENFEQRHNILIESKMHDISLPLLDDAVLNITSSYTIDEGASTQEFVQLYEREDELKFDYTYLPTKPQSLDDEIEIEQMREFYKEKLNDLESSISALDTTSKVSQELETVKKKIKTLDRQLKIVLKMSKDIRSDFENVKSDRYEAFMNCFENTVQKVDEIYKEMNGDTSAQASLYLENSDEPYLAGIRYDCIPPRKSYGQGNLSGGEIAVAALSLIFAIQSKNPSPFILLDEIDAALDQKNRKNVVKYIKNLGNRQQIIIISLHKELFSISDTLVGVYPLQNVSRVESNLVIMDLSIYQ